jgi:hypothetical protein
MKLHQTLMLTAAGFLAVTCGGNDDSSSDGLGGAGGTPSATTTPSAASSDSSVGSVGGNNTVASVDGASSASGAGGGAPCAKFEDPLSPLLSRAASPLRMELPRANKGHTDATRRTDTDVRMSSDRRQADAPCD